MFSLLLNLVDINLFVKPCATYPGGVFLQHGLSQGCE